MDEGSFFQGRFKIISHSYYLIITRYMNVMLHLPLTSVIDLEFAHEKLKFYLKNEYYDYYW